MPHLLLDQPLTRHYDGCSGIAPGLVRFGEGVVLMHRFLIAVTAAFAIAAVPMTAEAKPCRDAKGKFIKCPTTGAAPKKQCRDAKGKFIKCPA